MEYEIVRSGRRTLSVEIAPDLKIKVRAPYKVSLARIEKFLADNEKWINDHMKKAAERASRRREPTEEEKAAYIKAAREYLPERVKYFASIMGVCPSGVKITGAKTRYGSCSGKNSICFSYLVMALPRDLIDYVVVHELAHIKHHDHSRAFYDFLGKFMPDHKERQKRIKQGD